MSIIYIMVTIGGGKKKELPIFADRKLQTNFF